MIVLCIHYVTLHYAALRWRYAYVSFTLRLRYVNVTLRYATLRYATLRYATLRYATLRCMWRNNAAVIKYVVKYVAKMYMNICICICIYVYVWVILCICIYVYVYIIGYMYMYIFVCNFMYIVYVLCVACVLWEEEGRGGLNAPGMLAGPAPAASAACASAE